MNHKENAETKRIDWKNITNTRTFWLLVSLLAAFLLWMYVTSTEGVQIDKTFSGVKVVFAGEEALREASGLVITEQDSTTVDLTLSGTRRVISRLTSANLTAQVDLSNVLSDGRYSITYTIQYPNGVSADDVTVVHRSTDVINFYVDRLVTKTVEVEGEFTGSTAEGYLAADTIWFDPLAVKISGPRSAVSQVERAFVSITRQEVDKTLQYSTTYELQDGDGNVIDDDSIIRETEEVTVTLSVLATKTVLLDVTIVDGGGATRENTQIDIKPASITLAGDAATIDDVSKLILGTIDLSDFAMDFTQTYTIVPPNDTENLTGTTEAVVTVTILGMSTKNFTIHHDNISCVNVPEGSEAEVITEDLTVTIRAPEEVLEQIQENNLRAVADLADLNIASGVANPGVRIYIDGFPNAGVIGDYTVHINLRSG